MADRPSVMSLLPISLILAALQHCAGAPTVRYQVGEAKGKALLIRPEGKGPFPAVIYNHGKIVDVIGYQGARKHGYKVDAICQALAKEGYLVFVPLRSSGAGNVEGHQREVSRAVDYLKTREDVDASRIALMGFSRGGLLTLMVGVERDDLKGLLILAPAPGVGHFAETVKHVGKIKVPVLLLVEASDSSSIIEDYEMLERALKENKKEVTAIRYERGGGHRLFWDVGYYWKDTQAFLARTVGGVRDE